MTKKAFRPDVDAPEYKGAYVPYDIIKEGAIAVLVVLILTAALALVFSSPDEKAITIKTWSNADTVDFAQTAGDELTGTSAVAGYGAPYNNNGTAQHWGFLAPEQWVGVHIPINTTNDFVINPLSDQPAQPRLTAALNEWKSASSASQSAWGAAYAKVEAKLTYSNGQVHLPTTAAGPIPVLLSYETQMARSGALDQALIAQNGFYTTNYTKPLLFISDGTYFAGLASKQHLAGDQWGMKNETGQYPGQAWLWLYTFWYQISPYNTSASGDFLVWGTMMILTALLVLLPFIPGLRSVPRRLKIYRIIWREHYARQA
ncbi:MAG: hypothetical protein KGI65_00160 [Acidobacteriota bacterium]|nr:hypothetical protein [Acidobacteriota bacterium]